MEMREVRPSKHGLGEPGDILEGLRRSGDFLRIFLNLEAGSRFLVALEQPRGKFPGFGPELGAKTVPDLRVLFAAAGSRI
jgi:hypothetical protein